MISDKWQLVKEKQAELNRLTEEAWQKGEWELAALGERTLRTVEQSKSASDNLRDAMTALNLELGKLGRQYNHPTSSE